MRALWLISLMVFGSCFGCQQGQRKPEDGRIQLEGAKNAVNWDLIRGKNFSQAAVRYPLSLPKKIDKYPSVNITWGTDADTLLDLSTGVYELPKGMPSQKFILEAKLSYHSQLSQRVSKAFALMGVQTESEDTKIIESGNAEEQVMTAMNSLSWDHFRGDNIEPDAIHATLKFFDTFEGYNLRWESDNHELIDSYGMVATLPFDSEDSGEVRVTAVFSLDNVVYGKVHFNLNVVENEPSAEQKVQAAMNSLKWKDIKGGNSNNKAIHVNLEFFDIYKGIDVKWESDNLDLIDVNGVVTTLPFDSGDSGEVKVTAVLSLDDVVYGKVHFYLTVKKQIEPKNLSEEKVFAAMSSLKWSYFRGENIDQNAVHANLKFFDSFEGVDVKWKSDNHNLIDESGVVTILPFGSEDSGKVKITAVLSFDQVVYGKVHFDLIVVEGELSPEEIVQAALKTMAWSHIKGENSTYSAVHANLEFFDFYEGIDVEWKSDNHGLIDESGVVTTLPFDSEDSGAVRVTAVLSLNNIVYGNVHFDLIVIKKEPTSKQRVQVAMGSLSTTLWGLVKGENSDKHAIYTNLEFFNDYKNIDVHWESSKPNFVHSSGVVTRVPFGSRDNGKLRITAVLSLDNVVYGKVHLDLVVVKAGPSPEQRVLAAMETLSTDMWRLIKGGNLNKKAIRANLRLFNSYKNIDVRWESSKPGLINTAGRVNILKFNSSDNGEVKLTAVLSLNKVVYGKVRTHLKVDKEKPPLRAQQRWSGTYQCPKQKKMNLTVTINKLIRSGSNTHNIEATFSFHRSGADGSFKMNGTYNHITGSLNLYASTWIKKPGKKWVTLNTYGKITKSGSTYRYGGHLSFDCGGFSLALQ